MKRLTPNDLAEAAALLGHGEVVGIPTDTVYGIGCRLESTDGVARLFALKDRPGDVVLRRGAFAREFAEDLVAALVRPDAAADESRATIDERDHLRAESDAGPPRARPTFRPMRKY